MHEKIFETGLYWNTDQVLKEVLRSFTYNLIPLQHEKTQWCLDINKMHLKYWK